MMAEDRALTLSGYEVYRFGTAELAHPDIKNMLTVFFEDLLSRHDCAPAPSTDTPPE